MVRTVMMSRPLVLLALMACGGASSPADPPDDPFTGPDPFTGTYQLIAVGPSGSALPVISSQTAGTGNYTLLVSGSLTFVGADSVIEHTNYERHTGTAPAFFSSADNHLRVKRDVRRVIVFFPNSASDTTAIITAPSQDRLMLAFRAPAPLGPYRYKR
jgi:hypothetical protein